MTGFAQHPLTASAMLSVSHKIPSGVNVLPQLLLITCCAAQDDLEYLIFLTHVLSAGTTGRLSLWGSELANGRPLSTEHIPSQT